MVHQNLNERGNAEQYYGKALVIRQKKQAIEEKVIVTKNRDVYVFHSARMSWRSGGLGSGARSVLVA